MVTFYYYTKGGRILLKDQLNKIRAVDHISANDVINSILTNFVEIHGDRVTGDDHALVAGIGLLARRPVTILAINRGQSPQERQRFNGGMVASSGYRKARRLVLAAQRFNRPVISLIDTPGADASVSSENHGQSQAIADMIDTMGQLTVPNVAVFLGEGHSGGALAFANANRILMLENALFSVASPEAVAAIVTTDHDISDDLPMTATALKKLGLVDQIIAEDDQLISHLRRTLQQHLEQLDTVSGQQLVQQRQHKFIQFLAQWRRL